MKRLSMVTMDDGGGGTSRSERQNRDDSMEIHIKEHVPSMKLSDQDKIQADGTPPHYRRNYVRFRTNGSRSRSRENRQFFRSHYSIDYRQKLILFGLQTMALLHLCSIVYCHQQQPYHVVKYTMTTLILFNLLAYICVQYDTQQAEHGALLFGENPLLFLLWYGGLFGGGLALLVEKHKHLRSRAFTYRLGLVTLLNATWPFLAYVWYMCGEEFQLREATSTLSSSLEAFHAS